MHITHRYRIGIVLALVAGLVLVSCSRRSGEAPGGALTQLTAPSAGPTPQVPDTGRPGPPKPPPGPPPPPVPVAFAGADSARAGITVSTFWVLTNDSPRPFSMPYTLSGTRSWPGLPSSGTFALAGRESRTLVLPVAVPDTAAAGFAPLLLMVTTAKGANASASGHVFIAP